MAAATAASRAAARSDAASEPSGANAPPGAPRMPPAPKGGGAISTTAQEAKLTASMVALPTSVFPQHPTSTRRPNRLPSTAANPSPNAMQKKPSAPTYGVPIPNENSASAVSDTA